MLKYSFLLSFSVATLGFSCAACSSSDGGSSGGAGEAGDSSAGANSSAGSQAAGASSGGADAAGADSGGANSAGADMGGADSAGADSGGASSGGGSAGSTSAGGAGPLPPGTSSCQYSVTGGATETSPSSPSVCGLSKVTTAYGGGFSASLSGGFQDAAGNIVALACIVDSPTAPAAGDSWSLTTAAKSQGNCQFNITKAQTATLWAASANDALVTGAATVKFNSATLTHGIYKPTDVYYFFDATLEATLPGQSAGAAEVKISGRFQLQTLPIGS